MREDDGSGHYVPILRRIIVLVAVIVAVPVMLWTITVFVRTYVGPPRIPTFHQLVSTASINAPSARTSQDGAAATQDAAPARDRSSRRTRPPIPPTAQCRQCQRRAIRTRPHPALRGQAYFRRLRWPRPTATARRRKAARVAADADKSLSAAQPISGPVPLPRRRPREAEMRTADISPANVPMPRRRPDGASQSASASGETTGSSPVGFIQNLFH